MDRHVPVGSVRPEAIAAVGVQSAPLAEPGGFDTAAPLATGKQGKNEFVVIWTNLYAGKAKVFSTTLGHNTETCQDPRFLDLLTRGLLWSTGHLTDDGKPAPGFEARK